MESNKYKNTETIKLLCSYAGKILPRYTDDTLRCAGGLTRVLAVDRSISFTELMVKLEEFCGSSVNLWCQLPIGDLETLILITSDDRLRRDGRHPISGDDLPLIVRAFSSTLLSDYSYFEKWGWTVGSSYIGHAI